MHRRTENHPLYVVQVMEHLERRGAAGVNARAESLADLLQSLKDLIELHVDRLDPSATSSSLGYASVASFHRAFRRVLGVTPADYRRSADVVRHERPSPLRHSKSRRRTGAHEAALRRREPRASNRWR